MELTNEQIKQIYDEYIEMMNDNDNGVYYRVMKIEKDHVHALIRRYYQGEIRYQLCTIIERYCVKVSPDDDGYDIPDVEMLHSWGKEEYPLARIAFKCFCHEEPEEIGKMWEGNRQIALYSDEARHKDELISELIDKSGAL